MTLQEFYNQIPSMVCKPGCSDCCGPVPFCKDEWDAVADKRPATSLNCPYICKTGCAIYPNRPFMCRLFGTLSDPKMRCPHGYAPAQLIPEGKARLLLAEYLKLYNGAENNP